MPIPESPRVEFEINPLAEVICQLKFPTILQIGAEPPSQFQNIIREQYPLYSILESEPEITHMLMRLQGEEKGSIGGNHKFQNENQDRTFSLTNDFIAFSVDTYKNWSEFSAELDLGREALESVYAPAFYSRVGLRYRNVINKTDLSLQDKPWERFLNPSVIGFLGNEDLRSDIIQTKGEVTIQLDIPNSTVKLRHASVTDGDGNEGYIIDADIYTEERTSTDEAGELLYRYNRVAGNLFQWCITEELRSALRPIGEG